MDRRFAFTPIFHLTMWFFQFINGLYFKWEYVIWRINTLLVWIGLWNKLRVYRVPSDPVRWSYQDFGFLWRAFILIWMLGTKNDFNVSHRKQVNAPSTMKLVTSFMNFECQPFGIFEGLSYHQEDESIYPTIFAATIGLGDKINKLVSSNFMGKVSSFLVIFDTGDTYSYSSNKGDFVKLEEMTFLRKIKGTAKNLEIYGFGIVKYSVKS